MGRIVVENFSDESVHLGIEPWGHLEILRPKCGRVDVDYEGEAEIGFAITSNGSPNLDIVADRVSVTHNGQTTVLEP